MARWVDCSWKSVQGEGGGEVFLLHWTQNVKGYCTPPTFNSADLSACHGFDFDWPIV